MKTPTDKILTTFGIPFYVARRLEILDQVRMLARGHGSSSVIFANAHVVVEAHWQPELKSAINDASLVVPDGVPITWVLKGKGRKGVERYSGPDLMEDIFQAEPGARHFFIGSTTEILERIRGKFKGAAVGFYSPPFSNNGFSKEEMRKQLAMVEQANPDYVWVGLGAPKQEYYVTQMASRSSCGVWLGVGAAFDFYAEVKSRAPKFLQQLGLEWSFRLASEPRRLAHRYFSTNPIFIRLALAELLAPRRQDNAAHPGSDREKRPHAALGTATRYRKPLPLPEDDEDYGVH